MRTHVIKFKERSDGGPRMVGPFTSTQTADEHLNSLANRGITFLATTLEIVGWLESLQHCEGDDEFSLEE